MQEGLGSRRHKIPEVLEQEKYSELQTNFLLTGGTKVVPAGRSVSVEQLNRSRIAASEQLGSESRLRTH